MLSRVLKHGGAHKCGSGIHVSGASDAALLNADTLPSPQPQPFTKGRGGGTNISALPAVSDYG